CRVEQIATAQAVLVSRSRFSSSVSAAALGGAGAWARASRLQSPPTTRMASVSERPAVLPMRPPRAQFAGGCGRVTARKYDGAPLLPQRASAVRPNQQATRHEYEAQHDA